MDESLKNCPTVGFSHTISADFEHPRQMSEGVVVLSVKMFGKTRLF